VVGLSAPWMKTKGKRAVASPLNCKRVEGTARERRQEGGLPFSVESRSSHFV